mmetsp:Transcript_16068/g.20362  ORF Transcript_16068/g.20362 Transcript_16068/m.20362 type:complete len:121 (-) Transcript_16068:44-406(-)
MLISLPYFALMRKLNLLRVPLIHEIIGLDIAEMGAQARIDNLVAQAIYRAHQRNMKAQSYHELYRKIKDAKNEKTRLPDESPSRPAANDSLQSAVDINKINMEIESESSKRPPSLQIEEE